MVCGGRFISNHFATEGENVSNGEDFITVLFFFSLHLSISFSCFFSSAIVFQTRRLFTECITISVKLNERFYYCVSPTWIHIVLFFYWQYFLQSCIPSLFHCCGFFRHVFPCRLVSRVSWVLSAQATSWLERKKSTRKPQPPLSMSNHTWPLERVVGRFYAWCEADSLCCVCQGKRPYMV